MQTDKIKLLIEIRHPARVHSFKNLYWKLIKANHEVLVVVIDKEVSIDLLEAYDISYYLIGKNKKGILNKFLQLLQNELLLLIKSLKFKPDILIGSASPVLAHISFLLQKPYIAFSDTEHADLTWKLSKPFITKIVTPKCFLKDFGKKHVRFEGYKELAYLHPNYFEPDSEVYNLLGIGKDEKYIFLRFISWNAQHDTGHKGLSDKIKVQAVNEFSKTAKVFISAEGKLPEELEKYRINIPPHMIHHVLHYASLYFGESGTMATEAAILGTPTVRVSTIAKLLGNSQELSEKYKLLEFYDSDVKGFNRALELLRDEESKEKWQKKAAVLIKDKIDVTQFMFEFVTNKKNYG